MKLLSLKLFTVENNAVLASLNVFSNTCLTYSDYSSCSVDVANTHRSQLRVLVYDLEAGERRRYGCRALALRTSGDEKALVWSVEVWRPVGECRGPQWDGVKMRAPPVVRNGRDAGDLKQIAFLFFSFFFFGGGGGEGRGPVH